MANTYGRYEKLVRDKISDSIPEYRWPSRVVIGFVADAVKYLRSIRPEARYDGLTLSPEPIYPELADADSAAVEAAQALSVVIAPRWEDGIVYYAAAKCLEMDSADTANATMSQTFFTNAVSIFRT